MKSSNSNKIDLPESNYLFVGPSKIPYSGNGLYTAIELFKEEIISIFKGEILNETQAQKRVADGQDQYFINLPTGRIMDSKNVECFAKYANDAEGLAGSKFKNNTLITLDDDDNVCIEALRNIKANEELFCGYGKKYWSKHG